MEFEIWYNSFIKSLLSKYPKKSQLTTVLMDMLNIEREAAYRRLRKEVLFSITEIIKLSSAFNISLDSFVIGNSPKISFQMQPINYLSPSDDELKFLRHVIHSINSFKDSPDTEFMDVCNKLPRQLIAGFNHLNQYYLFKWMHQYGKEKRAIPFSQVFISDEKWQVTSEYYKAVKTVPQTIFIFDKMIFENLVNEILYFNSIQLITDKEKELLKSDLNAMLDYLFEVATYGYYPETKKKVSIYIAQIHINTNYNYTYTNKINICFVHVFDKYEIYTFDNEMVEKFKSWMLFKKDISRLISETDTKYRIEFFKKQRQIVDTL